MDAVNLYVNAFSAVMEVESTESADTWIDVHRLVASLKDALSCFVCKKLSTNAMSSTTSSCKHYICETCLNVKNNSNPVCDSCEDRTKFARNTEVDTLINCYRKMCEYAINTRAYRKFSSNGCKNVNLDSIVDDDDYKNAANNPKKQLIVHSDGESSLRNGNNVSSNSNSSDSCEENKKVSQRAPKSAHKSAEDTVRRTRFSSGSDSDDFIYRNVNFRYNSTDTNSVPLREGQAVYQKNSTIIAVVNDKVQNIRQENVPKTSGRQAKSKKFGCRCGLATAVPGKLTCYGQRCPCYVQGNACLACKCRGCRNPRNRNLRSNSPRSADESSTANTTPFAANHSLISIGKISGNQTTDEDTSDIDIDN